MVLDFEVQELKRTIDGILFQIVGFDTNAVKTRYTCTLRKSDHLQYLTGAIHSFEPKKGYAKKTIDFAVKHFEDIANESGIPVFHEVSFLSPRSRTKLSASFCRNGYELIETSTGSYKAHRTYMPS